MVVVSMAIHRLMGWSATHAAVSDFETHTRNIETRDIGHSLGAKILTVLGGISGAMVISFFSEAFSISPGAGLNRSIITRFVPLISYRQNGHVFPPPSESCNKLIH